MKRSRVLALSLLAAVLAGCAASSAAGDGQSTSHRQGNLISSEEVREAQAQIQSRNAYDLIRSLRPNWLQSRGQQSLTNPTAGQVIVYLDGTRAGNVDILRQIPTMDLQAAQYLSATEATARFGTGHSGGAILITTRRR